MTDRDVFISKVAEAISGALYDGDWCEASGHLGGDGIRALAVVAVDAMVESLQPPF